MALTKVKAGVMAVDSVATTSIVNDAVDVNKLASNSVVTASIVDSTGSSDGVTTAKLATDCVTADKLASNSVVTDSILNDAVTLDKMASGTDGNLITYDANGNPAHVPTGSAGEVLTSAGAGSPPVFAAAGGAYSSFSIKTTAYTASAGDQIIVNSASAVTITLPASPSIGDTVFVKARGGGTVTLARNGSNFESATTDGTLFSGNKTQINFIDSTVGWEEL